MFEQLGLIGCGLMGGSFALALKRAKLVKRVVGYSKSPSTTERARQLGVIDVAAPSALLAVSGADLVLIAVPVGASEATFKAIRHGITEQMLVMDVGSTKGDVIEAARRGLQDQLRQLRSRAPDRRQGSRRRRACRRRPLHRTPGRADADQGHAALQRAARHAGLDRASAPRW